MLPSNVLLNYIFNLLCKSAKIGFFETSNQSPICIFLPVKLIPVTEQLDFLFSCVVRIVILDLIYFGFIDTILPNEFFNLSYFHVFSNTTDILIQVNVCKIHWHLFSNQGPGFTATILFILVTPFLHPKYYYSCWNQDQEEQPPQVRSGVCRLEHFFTSGVAGWGAVLNDSMFTLDARVTVFT